MPLSFGALVFSASNSAWKSAMSFSPSALLAQRFGDQQQVALGIL
jgi:hypothetical protein